MCGIFGIINYDDAAAATALGLHALQHRGQEAAGITSAANQTLHVHKALGYVGDIFSANAESVFKDLPGRSAIGHVRYSTAGEADLRNAQPITTTMALGQIAIAHNGNLTNAIALRQQLIEGGHTFQTTSDTEVILKQMAVSQGTNTETRLVEALKKVVGAYSLILLSQSGAMIGLRDPFGVRPLILGQLGKAHILTSETVALDIINAKFVREIEPGEMVTISPKGEMSSHFPFPKVGSRPDIFEFIYFSRPDSTWLGQSIYEVRKNIGRELARESAKLGIQADVVVPIPDSGVPAALGYAKEAELDFNFGIIRNHYVGRTFIEPTSHIRHLGVKLKHNANPAVLKGKSVILVDDSIVRGTTSGKIVDEVRRAGAREVHFRVASPPVTHPSFYGIDTPRREDLIAANHSLEEIREKIGVDSLSYLSLDGLYRALGEKIRNAKQPQFEDSMFTGDYPIPLIDYEAGALASDHKGRLREVKSHDGRQ